MFTANMNIKDYDPILWQAIVDENRRQEEHIELIASENYASPRVMEAQGSQFTNKYAEGYPGKRYYGGCEYADIVEPLIVQKNYSVQIMQTCNLIQVLKPMQRFMAR